MQNRRYLLWLLLLLWGYQLMAVDFSGFVDFRYQHSADLKSFIMGPFELDLVRDDIPNFHFEGAIVVEENEVALGQTLVEMAFARIPFIFQVGLFDVPFGIDYELYATADRFFVNAPLSTELLFDGGWGDVGVNVAGEFKLFRFNLFLLNGMGVDYQYYTPVNQLCDNNSYKTPGLNASLKFGHLEPGISFSKGRCDGDDDIWSRGSIYLKATIKEINLRAEFIKATDRINGQENNSKAFYLQFLSPIRSDFQAGLRLEWFKSGTQELHRECFVLGYSPHENLLIKIQKDWVQNPDFEVVSLIQSQVVVTF